jgi:hypothetical protein
MEMPKDTTPQLRELVTLCRRLTTAKRKVDALEHDRDALIRLLRAAGVPGADIASCTGLSPGRVTQIAGNHNGRVGGKKAQ